MGKGKKIGLGLTAVMIIIAFASSQNVYSENAITVSTDKSSYSYGETLVVTGFVSTSEENPLITIIFTEPIDQSPIGKMISSTGIPTIVDFFSTNGSFERKYTLKGDDWKKSGKYTISIKYEKSIAETTFFFTGPLRTSNSISVSTDKQFYSYGETLVISGTISSVEADGKVTLLISDPSTEIIDLSDFIPGDKRFEREHTLKGPEWNISGAYTILALYGKNQQPAETIFFFTLPEPFITNVPEWIKTNAKWWAEGRIDDSDFVSGIQFMIKEKIINIPNLPEQASETAEEKVPDWIRNNAGWWADGLITEDDFVKGIQYLVEQGIIKV